jgi:transposase InsO family protein
VSAATEVRRLVRDLRGLSGAASLARSVPAVSRRQAAALKCAELAALERERKASSGRVEVLAAGVIRGFDQLELRVLEGRRYLLVAADAAVPYRTSITLTERYDQRAVAGVLDDDFTIHGAPLVCRLDRASCHRAPEVVSVFRHHRVLPLHGPPRHPRYYGQLERQNREHRAWLTSHGLLRHHELADRQEPMRTALNDLWRRPTLKWRTASCAWEDRTSVTVDRDSLRDDVERRAAALRDADVVEDLADRLAIEHALAARGLLRVTNHRRVLCD